jgi:hypothetical protein
MIMRQGGGKARLIRQCWTEMAEDVIKVHFLSILVVLGDKMKE